MKELLRRVLIYLPLIIQIYVLRLDFMPTIIDSTSASGFQWLFKTRNLGEPLSIVSFLLALLTFERQYSFRSVTVNKPNQKITIKFNGLLPAAANVGVGLFRALLYFFGINDPDRAFLFQKFVRTGLIVALVSIVSLVYSLTFSLTLKDQQIVLYHRLSRFWKSAHSFLIILLFLLVCFIHKNVLI